MEPTFKRHHAEEILKPCGIENYFTIDERGVLPKIEYDATMPVDSELMRWRPARVFQGEPDAPEVADTPMLPFPFRASELAAFMLEGVGTFVLGTYGSSSDGPDPISLKQIDPDSKARTALIQAYAAYREAQTVAGAYPLALDAEADRTRKAYNVANNEANEREGVFTAMPGTEESTVRRERAVASTSALKSEMEATATKAQDAAGVWLNAMARQLLQSVQSTATPAPVVAASNGKRWTVERLAELKAYRDIHTMPETAKQFGITEQRIRQLLPSGKPKPKPFDGLIHRMK